MICPASVYWEEYRKVNTRSSKDRYQDEACYHCVQKKLFKNHSIYKYMDGHLYISQISELQDSVFDNIVCPLLNISTE